MHKTMVTTALLNCHSVCLLVLSCVVTTACTRRRQLLLSLSCQQRWLPLGNAVCIEAAHSGGAAASSASGSGQPPTTPLCRNTHVDARSPADQPVWAVELLGSPEYAPSLQRSPESDAWAGLSPGWHEEAAPEPVAWPGLSPGWEEEAAPMHQGGTGSADAWSPADAPTGWTYRGNRLVPRSSPYEQRAPEPDADLSEEVVDDTLI